jgi:hypothetical protein
VTILRRIFLVTTVLLTASSPALAESLQAQLGRCVRITGLLQRLACYDGVVKDAGIVAPSSGRQVPASPTASIPPAPVAPMMAAPGLASAAPVNRVPSATSSFGSESLPQARRPPSGSAKTITTGVASLSFDGTGHFTVTLDNGQVWRQLPGDMSILRQTQVGSVRIARSVFGSYDLSLPGQHASYRVERLR